MGLTLGSWNNNLVVSFQPTLLETYKESKALARLGLRQQGESWFLFEMLIVSYIAITQRGPKTRV